MLSLPRVGGGLGQAGLCTRVPVVTGAEVPSHRIIYCIEGSWENSREVE
jgi:hypothetical protein